jgi:hypothetical protein
MNPEFVLSSWLSNLNELNKSLKKGSLFALDFGICPANSLKNDQSLKFLNISLFYEFITMVSDENLVRFRGKLIPRSEMSISLALQVVHKADVGIREIEECLLQKDVALQRRRKIHGDREGPQLRFVTIPRNPSTYISACVLI